MINSVLAGIDIGASKTNVVLTDFSGTKLKTFHLNGKNFTETSPQNYSIFLEQIINEISSSNYSITAICFGIAGCAEQSDHFFLETELQKRFPKIVIQCKSDIDIALNACNSSSKNKLVLILGTGSIVVGQKNNGEIVRSGGWGYLFDDSNGASSLGKVALSYLTHIIDNKENDSPFLESYSTFFNSSNLTDEIKRVYQSDSIPQSLANCSKPLLKLWNQNHKKSVLLINTFIQLIAENVLNVMNKLNTTEKIDLFLVGGLINHHPKLRKHLCKALPSNILPSSEKITPEHGAIKFIQETLND